MKYATATPYTACFVIIKRANKIAFVLRSNVDWMKGYYGLPSGKIEKGEPALQATCREAKEEVGVDIAPEQLKFLHVVDRHDEIDWVDFYFEAQQWQGEPYNAEPDMHSELAWLDPNNLPDNVIPSVRNALQAIDKGENYSEYGWVS